MGSLIQFPDLNLFPDPNTTSATTTTITSAAAATPTHTPLIIPKLEPKLEPFDESPLPQAQAYFSSPNPSFNDFTEPSSNFNDLTQAPENSSEENNVYSEFYRISELFRTAFSQQKNNDAEFVDPDSQAIVPVPENQLSAAVAPPKRKYQQRSSELVRVMDLGVEDQRYFRDVVRKTRMIYDSLRVFAMAEDEKRRALGLARRARGDLKASAVLRDRGMWLNRDKRIVGSIPGVYIGDLFFFRMELCVVGLHGQPQAGIDYVPASHSSNKEPIATSIIVSGGYEDDEDAGDVIIYTGHGGQDKHKNGNHDEALRLYEDMRSRGIVASNYTCASLLTLHYKSGDYSKALSLFSEMERNKIAADEVIYGLLIRIYGKLGLYEDAHRTFEEIEKLGLLSDEKTYITMAQVHLYSGDLEKALSTMEQMSSRSIWFSRFGFIVLLQCYVMKEDLASAEVTYQALSKTGLPDTGSCNNMLNLYLRLRLTEKAKDFVMQMRKDKVEFDEELLKTVLKVYCKGGMVGDAEQLMEEMSTSGHFEDSKLIQTFSMVMHGQSRRPNKAEDSLERLDQPVAIAFELILTLYSGAGNSSKTEEILKLLLKTANGLSIASQLVNKLIKEGEITKAECLYKLLIELGRIPEHVASASMISFYGKQQKLKQALEVFQMAAGSPTIAKPLYNSMIDAYAKSGKPEAAYLFYREASEEGQDLGAVAISMLVNALINGGKYREAENVIHGSFRDNLELDTVAYNTFIKAMLKAGKLHSAASLYEHMLSSGVVPSIQTYSIMISVYGRGRNLNKAVEMFNTARSMGVSLDEKAYTNLICYYGKAGKVHEASFLFGKMQEEGIKPGKVSYNIMMNVYATAGHHCETEELFLAMQKDGCLPDSLTYLALVRAYTLGLKYSKAEDAIISMQKVGFRASCAHFNLLLSAFVKAGLIREAERVYGELISTAGLSPDLACCRTMLRGYMDYGHVKEGISLFESIRECVEPDRFIMSAAVHLYKSVGMELRADQILHSMDSLGIPFLKNLEIGSKTKAPQVSELI